MKIQRHGNPSADPDFLLAGDIGGTKTFLGAFRMSDKQPIPVRTATYASRDYRSLAEIVRLFLADQNLPAPKSACLAVAGPVVAGASHLTNLPWCLRESDIAETLGIGHVRLVNDVQAAALGMLHLERRAYAVLRRGSPPPPQCYGWPGAPMAVLAPGTGLGEALLYWDGMRHQAVASEGGHAGFAPRTRAEIDLLRWLQRRHGEHISIERVASGPGLVSIYEFLRRGARRREPASILRARDGGDLAAAIGDTGLARQDAAAIRALEMFASILGAAAGDLALTYMAIGGVMIGGGIAPKILPALRGSAFSAAFIDKGRFAPFMRKIPVLVSKDSHATLLGAAHWMAEARN